ncbi:TTC36 protein, partial [Ibidorhyncha struthersii]|nr:TTC36 protein [Ibidorhyncha struthersii]
MATANDRAVLQTIFNPSTPFGDIPGLDEQEEEDAQEEGEVTLLPPGSTRAAGRRVAPPYPQPTPTPVSPRPGALRDLDAAIRLSRGCGRAACQSFVQRGLIHRLQSRDEEARRDFERAARLGSSFARRQLVLLNPYSALCNQMLCEMLGRLRNPGGAG